jgi:hypothetical protein
MCKSLLLLGTLLGSLTVAFGQSQNSVTGSWQATFRDSLSAGTLYFDLEAPPKGSVGGTYRTSTGKWGTVTGRQNRHGLKLTLTQEGACPGYYSVNVPLAEGTRSGTYSGHDCLGEHKYGVISMAPAGGNLSPPPLPPRTRAELDDAAAQAAVDKSAENFRSGIDQIYRHGQEVQQRREAAEKSALEMTTAQAEAASIKLGWLKQEAQYLDEIANLDATDPQYKTKLDSLRLKINLVREALSDLSPESSSESTPEHPSDSPTAIPPPTGPPPVPAGEVTLFDSQGNPVAYIAGDDGRTIYLWKGQPVAYLTASGLNTAVYGFNGRHLGWFEDGVIRDTRGYIVGFIQDAIPMNTRLEPLKGLKELKPLQSLRSLPVLKPLYHDAWAPVPLSVFLLQGRG